MLDRLGIIVPFYNQYEGLLETLWGLNSFGLETPITFVCMNAQDGSKELIQSKFRTNFPDRGTLQLLDGEADIAAALNAAEQTFGEQVDAVMIVHPGVVLTAPAAGELLGTLDEEHVGTVQPKLVGLDGRALSTGIVYMRGEPVSVDMGLPVDHPRITRRWSFKGLLDRALLIRRSLWREFCFRSGPIVDDWTDTDGEHHQELFMQHCYHDLDFTLRVHKAGWQNVYQPAVTLRSVEWEYPHDCRTSDLYAFYAAHGQLRGISALADSKEYFGTRHGNFPAIQTWRDPKQEPHTKISCIMADHDGCGTYRIYFPFRQLVPRGYQVEFGNWLHDESALKADVIVVQRQISTEALAFINRLREAGKPVIYEIDDYFHGLDDSNPVQREFRLRGHQLRHIEQAIYRCQGLVVSTPELGRQYGRFNTNTTVIRNCVELFHFPFDRVRENTSNEQVRIGWAGSATHDSDMQEMLAGLTRILTDFPQTSLVFIGTDYRQLFPDLPLNRLEWVPATYGHETPVESYYELLVDAQIDIGLAPLKNTPFNECKSDLKLLEMGALGIVAVASDVGPYHDFLSKKVDGQKLGFLARNEREWYKYLARLITQPELRMTMGRAVMNHVHQEYRAERQADAWEAVIQAVLAGQGHTPKLVESMDATGKVSFVARDPVHSLYVPYLHATAKQAYDTHHQRQAAMDVLRAQSQPAA